MIDIWSCLDPRGCFEHAGDPIKAAERTLSEDPSLPSIAFHLPLLAIEEMGKR
jgi:hypothetical protein